jgi:hypothetical protein
MSHVVTGTESVRELVDRLLRDQRMTNQEAAGLLGVSSATWYRLKKTGDMSVSQIEALASHWKIPISRFVEHERPEWMPKRQDRRPPRNVTDDDPGERKAEGFCARPRVHRPHPFRRSTDLVPQRVSPEWRRGLAPQAAGHAA